MTARVPVKVYLDGGPAADAVPSTIVDLTGEPRILREGRISRDELGRVVPALAPADPEPADAEPTDTEPTDAEPTGAEPTDTEPTDAGPAAAEG